MKYSVVIPVFNSERIVGTTVDATIHFFEANELNFEIILVNDGSPDRSWEVISGIALRDPRVVAINLLKNYGQHTANLCGFQTAKGDYVITMDDDLQNPPSEIEHLIKKAEEGYDLVIGRFREKRHSLFRRIGSYIVRYMNQRVFHAEKDLVLTNFRLIRRDVIDRICNYSTSYPYVPGLALMFSHLRTNVLVEHAERTEGKSNYSLRKILSLVSTILFNYSSYPLRLLAGLGIVTSIASFSLGLYYLVSAIFHETTVPGWTTLVVLLSFFNGMTILMLSTIGEYCVRLINQVSSPESYYVIEAINKQ